MVTSYALVVPISSGEAARRLVASRGIGRFDLKLGRRDGMLLIPISGPLEEPIEGATVEVAEFEPARPPGSYKEVVRVPEGLRGSLPSSFDIVGDLVLIKIPEPLLPYEAEIGRAILAAHPNLRGVFHDEGVEGELRIRRLRPLAGETRTRTTHSEYGASFRVDVAAAYFSPRLANDHERVARLVRPGETFVDATAGVGPFTVLAAKRQPSAKIVAMDLNPAALELLRENLALNRVQDRVRVMQGDSAQLLASVRPFQRAVVNLPHGGEGILARAWAAVASLGTLHYFVVWPEADMKDRATALVDRLSRETGRAGEVADLHVVHPYSARDRLCTLDINIR